MCEWHFFFLTLFENPLELIKISLIKVDGYRNLYKRVYFVYSHKQVIVMAMRYVDMWIERNRLEMEKYFVEGNENKTICFHFVFDFYLCKFLLFLLVGTKKNSYVEITIIFSPFFLFSFLQFIALQMRNIHNLIVLALVKTKKCSCCCSKNEWKLIKILLKHNKIYLRKKHNANQNMHINNNELTILFICYHIIFRSHT